MAYTKQTWTNGVSKLNATRMQYIEDGLEAAAIVADAAIPKAISGVATDKVPVYNGSAWVAQKIANAQVDAAAAIAYSKLNLSGSIVNADISSSAAIAVSKLAGAFSTYTPAWTATTNPAIGNGTLSGRYIQIGKLVYGWVKLTAGSTTTFGSGAWNFSLPVTASDGSFRGVGMASITDNSPFNIYGAMVRLDSTTTMQFATLASPTAQINSTTPITWATSDFLGFTFTYEAA